MPANHSWRVSVEGKFAVYIAVSTDVSLIRDMTSLPSVVRRLAALMSADVKGYARLMGEDEVATLRTLTRYREIMSELIRRFRGRVGDSPGDSVLAEFGSVVDAVQCAVEIQRELHAQNAELPVSRRMEFRIGINFGDVIVEGERLYKPGLLKRVPFQISRPTEVRTSSTPRPPRHRVSRAAGDRDGRRPGCWESWPVLSAAEGEEARQPGAGRRATHHGQHRGDLASMMRAVIGDVVEQEPKGLLIGLPREQAILDHAV